ncbi:MAG: SseB family protein [Pseudomonadota bacterium]
MSETALDRAMRESGGDAARGRAVDALLSSQLFLLLDDSHLDEGEPGDRLRPKTLPLEAGETALAFDTEERLAAFAGGEAAYAEVSGRLLAGLLAGEGVHLAVNPGVAPSELFHEAAALRWMAEATAAETVSEEAALGAVAPPAAASEALAAALDAKLAALAAGLAEAWLVQTEGADGPRLILALRERGTWGDDAAAERHRTALARALGETARLAAPEGPPLEAAFPPESAAAAWAAIRKAGLGFELPAPAAPRTPTAPGSDPEKPPRLR